MQFEQYERHTAWDRPGGVAERSGVGDLDVVIYSARKWARLALDGNPTVLLALFVPEEEVVFRDAAGAELTANAGRLVSRLAATRFLGYQRGQHEQVTGTPATRSWSLPTGMTPSTRCTRCTRCASACAGAELLSTGRITLPVPEPDRAYLRAVRRGEVPLAEILDAIRSAEARLEALRDSPTGRGSMAGCTELDFWARAR